MSARGATATAPALEVTLPSNVNAERSLLGAILLDGAEAISAGLKSEHFSLDSHRRIYARMLEMADTNRPIDIVTLSEELGRHKELKTVGGVAYLSSLTNDALRRSSIVHYVRLIREKSALRDLARGAEQLQLAACEADADTQTLTDTLANLEQQFRERSCAGIDLAAFPDPLELPSEPEAWLVPGILLKGGITVMAGAPGEGKTWQGLAMARAVAFGSEYLGRQCEAAEVIIIDYENPKPVMQLRWQTIFGGPVKGHVTLWAPWSGMGPVPMLGDSRLTDLAQPGRLLIIDTFSNLHDAQDENSAAEMAPILRRLRTLANKGCAILLLHHRGKSELNRYRGSSAIAGGCDIACSLLKDESGLLTLDVFKSRLTPEFKLAIRPDYEGGRFEVTHSPATLQRAGDLELINDFIVAHPGATQRSICEAVEPAGVYRAKALELLRRETGKLWRTEPGARKSIRYFPTDSSVTVPTVPPVRVVDSRNSSVLTAPDCSGTLGTLGTVKGGKVQ